MSFYRRNLCEIALRVGIDASDVCGENNRRTRQLAVAEWVCRFVRRPNINEEIIVDTILLMRRLEIKNLYRRSSFRFCQPGPTCVSLCSLLGLSDATVLLDFVYAPMG